MKQEEEIERLRKEVEDLKKQVQELKPKVKPSAPNPGLIKQGMHFIYNIGNTHAVLKNFGWAMTDCAKLAGFVGGCAVSAAKASPKAAKKILEVLKDNPKIAAIGVGTVAAIAVAEKVTRYEDEEGKTHHKCAIM
jgi:predicted nuclease with TOPRIM domain